MNNQKKKNLGEVKSTEAFITPGGRGPCRTITGSKKTIHHNGKEMTSYESLDGKKFQHFSDDTVTIL